MLRGENPRITRKSDRAALLTNGASKGSVTLQFDNNTIKRNVKDGKATGDTQFLPDDQIVSDICLQAVNLTSVPDNDRRALIMRLAEIDLSPDRVAEELKKRGISDEAIRKFRPLLMSSVKNAHLHAKEKLSELRGQWKGVTGENYGSAKAEDWEPEAPVVGDKEELSRSLSELDVELSQAREIWDAKLAPVSSRIRENEELLKKPKPLACPDCGSALLIVNGELESYSGDSINSERIKTIIQSQRIKRTQITEERDKELQTIQANKRDIEAQLRLLDSEKDKKTRADAIHEDIKSMAQITEMLSDNADGIPAQIIAESLGPLNERLREIADELGWKAPVIRGDISIARDDGHPYFLLSESAKWRIDTMLHILISELAEFPWLILDRMDVLQVKSRGPFLKWITEYGQSRTDEASILVMATLKTKPNFKMQGVESYWLE